MKHRGAQQGKGIFLWMNATSEENSFNMGFKSNIGDVTIQDTRACGPFKWGLLMRAWSRRGEGDTLEHFLKTPGPQMGNS